MLGLLEGSNFWLSENPLDFGTIGWNANCVRLVTWCIFILFETQQTFYMFNTQFDQVGKVSQYQSARLLWHRIESIAGTNAIVFTLGDFNVYRDDAIYTYLTKYEEGPKFHDAWANAASKDGGVSYTYHAWQGPAYHLEKDKVEGLYHIDWILSRPYVKVLETKVITECRNGLYPSDHYPVQTKLVLPASTVKRSSQSDSTGSEKKVVTESHNGLHPSNHNPVQTKLSLGTE